MKKINLFTIKQLINVSLVLAWYDIWFGLYIDQGHKTFYLGAPFVLLRFELINFQKDESKHRRDRVENKT
jgi:hypothetical protein